MAPTLSFSTQPEVSTPQPLSPDYGVCYLPSEFWMQLRTLLRLSEKELQIVRGIFAEQEPDDIARAMGVSRDLVYQTTQRIYVKLRIGSRLELILKVRTECLSLMAKQAQQTQTLKTLRAG